MGSGQTTPVDNTPHLPRLFLRSVTLTDYRQEKNLAANAEWLGRAQHTLEQVQARHGKLMHPASVVHAGRARLTALETMPARGTHRCFCAYPAHPSTHATLLLVQATRAPSLAASSGPLLLSSMSTPLRMPARLLGLTLSPETYGAPIVSRQVGSRGPGHRLG